MSAIYSAAQLTIVAAAGSNSTHGLPGIELHPRPGVFAHHEKLDQICLSAIDDEIYKPSSSLEAIATSVWSSRAWTYQEAVFSRRRLIFTENQAIFSCNKNTYFESGSVLQNGDFFAEMVPWYNLVKAPSDHEMKFVRKILEQYCQRTLSYQSDALRAISGTMNLLLTDGYFHLWGVPGRILKPAYADRVKTQQPHQRTRSKKASRMSDGASYLLHLDWRRGPEGCRRLGFPSWSPLGWSSGSIFWRDEFAYIGRISFYTSSGQKDISECIQYARTDHTRIPQQLSLFLKTAVVEVCEYEEIALLIDSRLQVIVPVIWDSFGAAEGICGSRLKAAVIAEDSVQIFLIFLEATGDNMYERRGTFSLEKKTLVQMGDLMPISGQRLQWVTSEKEKPSRKRNHDRSWGFTKDQRNLNQADEERLRKIYKRLKINRWWEYTFKEKRIILG